MEKKVIQRKAHQGETQGKYYFLEHRAENTPALAAMQRQINLLKRSLAQREHEVWTLKQLLLYR